MATYEYNSAIDQLDVTTGQAFQNESYLDKYAAARRENSAIIANDAFKVVQNKGMYVPCYKQVQEYLTVGGTATREGWYYFYSDGKKVQFATVDEAIEYVEAYTALLQWMSGIALSTPAQEETFEDMLAAQYNERLLNQVVYYTENADKSERVARLLQASRSGVLLADPADPSDQGCWYSFSEVSNIQRGRQYGWK